MRKITIFIIALLAIIALLLPIIDHTYATQYAVAFDPRQTTTPQACISVVGDSIPYGTVVFLVPGHGFPALRTEPLAITLERQLAQHGHGDIEVVDRSVPAANLSHEGKSPYQQFPQFTSLLRDNCRYIVMSGWNNDLNVIRQEGVGAYISDLYHFARLIGLVNPDTEILMLSHYWGEPQEFVEGYGVGVTLANYEAHLVGFENACEPDGRLGRLGNVHCLMIPPIFAGLSPTEFVILQRSQATLETMLYEPIPEDLQGLFEVFWRENPESPIMGDGVHLSAFGKRLYAEAIIGALLQIAPDL